MTTPSHSTRRFKGATQHSALSTQHSKDSTQYLIIGCGNTLRGDDALGPCIIESLRNDIDRSKSNVSLLAVPQPDIGLLPEIIKADVIIFVDARIDDDEEIVKVERIQPVPGPVRPGHVSHTLGMAGLLRLALDWYGVSPLCYGIMPKGYDFAFGDSLSERARKTVESAKALIIGFSGSGWKIPGREIPSGAEQRPRPKKNLTRKLGCR